MRWLDSIPLPLLAAGAVLFALAPFQTKPHLLEKLQMLFQGTLRRPLDWFDLVLHATPLVLLIIRLVRMGISAGPAGRPGDLP